MNVFTPRHVYEQLCTMMTTCPYFTLKKSGSSTHFQTKSAFSVKLPEFHVTSQYDVTAYVQRFLLLVMSKFFGGHMSCVNLTIYDIYIATRRNMVTSTAYTCVKIYILHQKRPFLGEKRPFLNKNLLRNDKFHWC